MKDEDIFKNPYKWLRKTAKKISKKYDIEEFRVITALLTTIYSGKKVYIITKK